ncbi:AAA family ATPase [Nisaea sediminum]|uniref:AAA family ATPase n=1 Tax=Nisaea sediminum TaxID=2775867 RepID=UPI00186924FE|nr:AAA family ATPase [Nisaea sediminum]
MSDKRSAEAQTELSAMGQAALEYAARGYFVLPCRADKSCLLPAVEGGNGGHHLASRDPDVIEAWWRKWPNANIGLNLKKSGLAAIDVDAYKPECAWHAFVQFRELPDTWEQSTPRGGRHFIFKDGGQSFRGSLCKGVDIKHDGYILLEPSEFRDEITGELIGKYVCQKDDEPAPVPDWVPRNTDASFEPSHGEAPDGWDEIDADGLMQALPSELKSLICDGQTGDRSKDFMHAVGWLKELHIAVEEVFAIMSNHPSGPAEKYLEGRADLWREVQRAYSKCKSPCASAQTASSSESGTEKTAFGWRKASEIDPVLDQHALIEDVIPRQGVVTVYGQSGHGKTFAVIDLAGHIAAGVPWRGKDVEQAAVAYVSSEGGRATGNRFRAWCSRYGISDLPLYQTDATLDLRSSEADVVALIDELRLLGEKIGHPIGLLVLDTLSRNFGGGDENSSSDMTKFIKNMDRVREAIGCTVLAVHHSGKDQARGARGHSSLRAAADAEIEITSSNGSRKIEVTKSRDGETGIAFGFRLDVVVMGRNRKGKDVTTCVAVPADFVQCASGKPRGKADPVLLEVLSEMMAEKIADENSAPLGANIPVSYKEWRNRCLASPRIADGDNAATRRKAFLRARDALAEVGQIAFDQEVDAVWEPKMPSTLPNSGTSETSRVSVVSRPAETLRDRQDTPPLGGCCLSRSAASNIDVRYFAWARSSAFNMTRLCVTADAYAIAPKARKVARPAKLASNADYCLGVNAKSPSSPKPIPEASAPYAKVRHKSLALENLFWANRPSSIGYSSTTVDARRSPALWRRPHSRDETPTVAAAPSTKQHAARNTVKGSSFCCAMSVPLKVSVDSNPPLFANIATLRRRSATSSISGRTLS